ncbi:sporulation integral membrane protein YtvI [Desulfolucanica intricata]|uniref:sporulation integral membrane protein YtvI n=1 Tax=Desulfolucanica intricata TaxID=1285191 RepID=UPI000831591F|nr:sporulation integral membrane protein YtvI [Desulfolucanica intricata]
MPKIVGGILVTGAVSLAVWVIFLAVEKVLPSSIKVLKYILTVLSPFILAVIVSVLIEPLVSFLKQRFRLNRGMAVALAMLIIIGFLGTLLTLVVLQLITELIALSSSINLYIKNGRVFIEDLIDKGINVYGNLPDAVIKYLQTSLTSLAENLEYLATILVNVLMSTVSGVPGILMVTIISLLATFFISKDREAIFKLWMRLIPAPWGERSIEVSSEVSRAFMGYIRAQIILVSITMIQSIVGLYLIGAEYALTFGLIIGFFDLLPVLGPSAVFIPWLVWSFLIGNYSFGIKLSVLYAMVLVVRQLLEAKIISANIGLHPLSTLIALYVGFKVLGVAGFVLGPILLIAIQAAIKAGQAVRHNT